MIISTFDDRLRLITQGDHAHFAAALLGLWRRDGLPEHPRRDEILFAAREHDNGWRETDAAPLVDARSGRPHDFITLPRPVRAEIWQRGIQRHAATRPWAALLIAEHALRIHRQRAEDAGWQEMTAAWRAQRDALAEQVGAETAEIAADDRWIELGDTLSLAVAAGWREPFSVAGVRAAVRPPADPEGSSAIGLEPFPLAGSTTFTLACRTVAERRYTRDSDFGVALACARWHQVPVRVVPLDTL